MGNANCGIPDGDCTGTNRSDDFVQDDGHRDVGCKEIHLESPPAEEILNSSDLAQEDIGNEDGKTDRTSRISHHSTVDEEVREAILEEEKQKWEVENAERLRNDLRQTWMADLENTRKTMHEDPAGTHRPANRYGTDATLPHFEAGKHIPILALINPLSGAMAGTDILGVCKHEPYYKERCFNILDVVRGQQRGGMLDVFRIELGKAKDEAKAMGARPRVISGGGDGTGSFALFIIFLALKADNTRIDDGLEDTGNGFTWTDQELTESFPAIAQLPLGSANDFANILGWGQKYPGDGKFVCGWHDWAAKMLYRWFDAVISPTSKVVNFDIWGILPPKGSDKCDFKLAELTGDRGNCPNAAVNGKRVLHLKEGGKPVPFFVCLYFSAGFGAYMTARFQLNRHKTPITNRVEYVRQALGIIAESTPPQLQLRLNGVEIDCEGEPYFPPRRVAKKTRGRGYREVGFYNINWQAHAIHGATRAPLSQRLGCSSREPVSFNDDHLDMFRWKFTSLVKNPGLRIQTDKKKNMELKYEAKKGQGVFFQWDGEARFAFSPTGEDFHIFIRKVLTVPVVLGPYHDARLTGPVENGKPVKFGFYGETPEEENEVRARLIANVGGKLEEELNATKDDITNGGFLFQGEKK
mmetsp:Transcript_20134/g.43042  ORF Transcript_20134/g.43042 Transcript_20134/m.43042 type:complete len:639 (-) Transcript_20134:191-2107(-)